MNSWVLAVAILTPYITFGAFESDTSPFYMAALVLYSFLVCRPGRRGALYTGLVSILLATSNLFLSNDPRILKFCATLLLAQAAYQIARWLPKPRISHTLDRVALLWLASGVLTLLYPTALEFLFFRLGTSEGRGATGLTPEPSFYGMASAFLFGISAEAHRHKTERDTRGLITQVIFLVSTALSMSLHALLIQALLLLRYQPKMATTAAALLVGSTILTSGLEDLESSSRLITLITSSLASGGTSLLEDESIAYRLANFTAIANAFTGTVTTTDDALASGVTILFVAQGSWGLLWLAMLLFAGWFKSSVGLLKVVSTAPVCLAMLFIGPISNPYFWIYLGTQFQLKKPIKTSE